VLVAASAACGSRDSLFVEDDEPFGGSGGTVGVGGNSGSVGKGGHAGSVGQGGVAGHAGTVSFGGFGAVGAIGGTSFGGFGNVGNVGGTGGGFSCNQCAVPDPRCAKAVCDPVNRTCQTVFAPEGAPCSNGMNLCQVSACQKGMCVPTSAVACPASSSPCLSSACDAGTGQCVTNPLSGPLCDDGDPCTQKDQCEMGKCQGGPAITSCVSNDKCCPVGCSSSNDNDCHMRQITLTAVDRGWYSSSGFHDPANKNTFTGYSPTFTYNSYFKFDLSSVNGKIVAATLILEEEHYFGTDTSEAASIWDASNPAAISSTGQSPAIYSDLQSGNEYGKFYATALGVGTTISTPLTDQAVADLNAARQGLFAMGVHIETLSSQRNGDEGLRFSMDTEPRKNQLVLTLQ